MVQPGETGKVPVRLSTGKRSGPIKKTISVVTNVPGRDERITLTIQGETWMPVDVKPATASFGRLAPNSADEAAKVQVLTITNNTSEDIKIGEIKSSLDAFQAELKPGKEYELTVKLVGELISGSTNATVTVATGLQEMPTLSVPVRAYVTAEVEVMPPKLTLGSNRTGDSKRQFYIRNNAKTPLKISDIQVSNPDIKATLEETKAGETFQVALEIPKDTKIAATGETVTFKTDNPRLASLTGPINEVYYAPSGKDAAASPAAPKLGQTSSGRPTVKSAATPQRPDVQRTPAGPGKAQRPTPTGAPTAPAAPAAAAPREADAKPAQPAEAAAGDASKSE